MSQRGPLKPIRNLMESKIGIVGAGSLLVLGALSLSGCTQGVSAGPEASRSASSNEAGSLTYEQEIQKGIEARPKQGVSIIVADYSTLEAAAASWTDAYFDCLFSGNIPLTPENRTEYVALMRGPITDNVPNDFKLAENFETCVSNLVTDNEYNRKLTKLFEPINANIVAQQVANNRVGVVNRTFAASDSSATSIKVRLSFTKRINDSNPADMLIGATLEVVDGKLVSTGPIS